MAPFTGLPWNAVVDGVAEILEFKPIGADGAVSGFLRGDEIEGRWDESVSRIEFTLFQDEPPVPKLSFGGDWRRSASTSDRVETITGTFHPHGGGESKHWSATTNVPG